MKYLVLKQLGIEKKMKTNGDSRTVTKNDAQSVIVSRHFVSGQAKKIRRFRSAFTTEQIQYLEREFKKFPYIGSGNRKEVSSVLNIPERAVKIWFQNRRMKEKKEVTNKETAEEEQKKINIARQVQSNIKMFNLQSHLGTTTHPYNVSQTKLKTIYPDPSITKANIKHFNGNKNVGGFSESSKSLQDKQRITVKNFNNLNYTETSNTRAVNKVAPVVSRQLNNKAYAPMKMMPNKNICITKVPPTQKLQVNPKLEHVKVKQGNPKGLTAENQNCSKVQSQFYQINPNQEQRYMPLHVQTLPQPPPFVPSNVVWKPVNMMPVLPGIAPPPQQIVHNNRFSVMQPNYPKEDCTRKCICNSYNTSQEMSPLMQVDGRLHLPSQYILAMPFNNHFDRI